MRYALAMESILETSEGDNPFIFEEGVGDIPVGS